jgi:hypothetical protein
LEGSSRRLFQSTKFAFVWRGWGEPWKLSVRLVGNPKKIRTRDVTNTKPEPYRYTETAPAQKEHELKKMFQNETQLAG